MPKRSSGPGASHQNSGISATHFIKAKASTRTYEECMSFLNGAEQRRVASNVYVRLQGYLDPAFKSIVEVVLYATPIVTYYSDGSWEADNGGYSTLTTMTRLNQFGPAGASFGHCKMLLCCHGQQCGRGRRFRITEFVDVDGCQRRKLVSLVHLVNQPQS